MSGDLPAQPSLRRLKQFEVRRAGDHVQDVRVDEEVLPEDALRADVELLEPPEARLGGELAAHQPNSRAAVASTAASSSS